MRIVSWVAVVVLAVCAAPGRGAVWQLEAVLDGLQEVPPVASPGTGYFTGTLDDVSNQLDFTLSFSGLVAPVTASHIHGPAGVGVNGPVIINFGPLGLPIGVTSGALANSTAITPANTAIIVSGNSYVNIHTSAFPGGEIRGQIAARPVPEPGTLALLGLGCLAMRKRRPTPSVA